MNIGQAMTAVMDGRRMARRGWDDAGRFIFLVPASTFTVNRPPLLGIYPEGTVINYGAHIDMSDGEDRVWVWAVKQVDVMANDWYVVE